MYAKIELNIKLIGMEMEGKPAWEECFSLRPALVI